jgi:hypothetical protein
VRRRRGPSWLWCGGFESDADAFSRLCHGADVLMCGGYIEAGKVMGRVKHVQTF